MTLYEITSEMRKVQELATEEPSEEIEAMRAEVLAAIESQFDAKLLGIARVIRNLEADVEAIKTEQDRLAKKRRARERNIAWLKDYARGEMLAVGRDEVSDGVLKVAVQRNPPKVARVDEDSVPVDYLREVPARVEVDKKAILEDWKAGADVSAFATIEQEKGVRIR